MDFIFQYFNKRVQGMDRGCEFLMGSNMASLSMIQIYLSYNILHWVPSISNCVWKAKAHK